MAIAGVVFGLGAARSSATPVLLQARAATVRAAAPAPCMSGACYVAVSVATLWVKPWFPRGIDLPALRNPAQPGAWLEGMNVAQREWLVGRLETQALYATRVIVIGRWRRWSHVVVPSQPTNRDPRGYPGWVPSAQLTGTMPPRARTVAVVTTRSASLWSRWSSGGVAGARVMQVSFDSRLAVVRAAARYVEVELIGGRRGAIPRGDVDLHAAGSSWSVSGARVVARARRFLGLPYLWAGTSGFGYDCSGFMYALFHSYGRTLPRDADQQAAHGTFVDRHALRPGDLVFFRAGATGPVTHVGLYIGAGEMIDAPHTGASIRIEPVGAFAHYAGARRYVQR